MAILAYDDVMLREPRLLVPGMQPLQHVMINPSHPLKQFFDGGIIWLPSNNNYDYVSRSTLTLNGTQTFLRSIEGTGVTFSNSISLSGFSTSQSQASYFGVLKRVGTTAYQGPFQLSTGNSGIELKAGSSGNNLGWVIRGVASASQLYITENVTYAMCGAIKSGTSYLLARPITGGETTGTAGTNTFSARTVTGSYRIGRSYDAQWGGWQFFACVTPVYIDQERLEPFLKDPFQLFVPA